MRKNSIFFHLKVTFDGSASTGKGESHFPIEGLSTNATFGTLSKYDGGGSLQTRQKVLSFNLKDRFQQKGVLITKLCQSILHMQSALYSLCWLVAVVMFCHHSFYLHKTFNKGQKPDLCASYHTQCIISTISVHHQCIISASSVHHKCIINRGR